MQETVRREVKANKELYVCPECGKPFSSVSATESHLGGVYEVRLKAWH